MKLPDINVLVYAHRPKSPEHPLAYNIVKELANSLTPFALTSIVISGFLRLVTNHRLYKEPTPIIEAINYIEILLGLEHCRLVEPGPRHWKIFSQLLAESKATGNFVSDAYLAAIAVEHGCTLLTHDADFRKFPALKIEKL